MISVALVGQEGGEADDKPPPTAAPVGESAATARPGQGGASREAAESQAPAAWDDWLWQLRNRIRSFAALRRRFPTLRVSAGMAAAAQRFPLAVTPYYASLIRCLDPSDPVFCMCIPDGRETLDPPFLKDDPLGEDEDMPVPGLVHRYGDRALLLATTACAAYCRHCTRKRVAGQTEECVNAVRLAQATEYLSVHPEIHDVIISGGDPFTMKTEALERVLRAIRSAPSVDVIRIGTRTPVVMPMRITDELVRMLRQFHPLYVNTHFNHPVELTPDAEAACCRLADAGIPLGNQSVLLRGVNDSGPLLAELFRRLLRVRVRPYYLFQCDLVRGVEHFRTPLTKGLEVMEYLRGRLSGLAIPTFVVDAPYGGGKIPLLPNYVVAMSPTHTVLRNFEGTLVAYPEPCADAVAEPAAYAPAGVADLLTGRVSRIAPADCARGRRRKPNQEMHSPAAALAAGDD